MINHHLEDVRFKYITHFDNLYNLVAESELRIISIEDSLFITNVNFFIKSYLVNLCTYCEAMLQEIAILISKDIHQRLSNINIPINYLYWQLSPASYKEKDLKFEMANLCPNPRDISEKLSANPYKTVKLFQLLGIDLNKCEYFNNHKDIINSIVNKRNNIIHHNDDAVDISFRDLKEYILIFKNYLNKFIDFVQI